MRSVAPSVPVPERRKTMREPLSKMMRTPCFFETEPSIGSVYSKSSAIATFWPSSD